MSLPQSLTTVTSFSKIVALVVFTLLPIAAFFFGMSYQRAIDGNESIIALPMIPKEQKACTMEAQLCPDGTAVGRSGPNCEFAPCPSKSPISVTQVPHFDNSADYICPQEEWLNCMPGFGPADSRCTTEFLQWAQKACPGFKGATY